MNRILVIGFAVSLASAPAQSQATMPPYRFIIRPDSASQKPTDAKVRDLGAVAKRSSETDDMKAALHDLIIAQEKYWNDHGSYTTDGAALGTYPSKSGQSSAQVIFAGSRGWTGVATDRALKGKSCVVYIGSEKELPGGVPKTMGGIAATAQGVSVCDES
jgi:hypothetical protein